jgi:hypothetical protein
VIKKSSLAFKFKQNKNKNNLKPISLLFGFVAISTLIAFLIGGFILGKNPTIENKQNKIILLNK